jgi:hypothetical protein
MHFIGEKIWCQPCGKLHICTNSTDNSNMVFVMGVILNLELVAVNVSIDSMLNRKINDILT